MSDSRINIAIIEPSNIIYEGLSNLLLKQEKHFYVFRIFDLEELNSSCIDENYNAVIINPSILLNKTNDFLKLKKKYVEISWIGLIYSFFDADLLNKLDELVTVTDSIELITNKLSKSFDKLKSSNTGQELLSKRETDVLIQLVKGLSNKEIAEVLNISIHTVISHRKNINEKTGIKSLSGLTIYAITKKITSLDSI